MADWRRLNRPSRMKFGEFKASLAEQEPPSGLSPALAALWWAYKKDWEIAHSIVMNEADPICAWVHAYLHRVEGDLDNARYWYGQAKRAVSSEPLDAECDAIARELLEWSPPRPSGFI
ncbi:MAG: hypothetical protein ACJ8F3_16510 [Xanthobacteraceae bacterium]